MKIILKSFFLFFLLLSICYSQTYQANDRSVLFLTARIGIPGNIHISDFSSFQGSVDCDIFKNGFGFGSYASLGLEFKRSSLIYGFDFQLIHRYGKLTVSSGFPTRDPNTGQLVYVETENSLIAKPIFIDVRPYFSFILAKKLISGPLLLNLSAFAGIPFSSNFKQTEKIINPENAVFISGDRKTRERLIIQGQIERIAKIEYGLAFGLQNCLKIGQNTFLTQDIFINFAFNNISTDVNWKVFSLGLALGLKIPVFEKKYYKKQDAPIEPTKETVKKTIASSNKIPILPYSEPKIGIEIDSVVGEINYGSELLASLPIVNSVFFKQNSFNIDEFYILNKTKNPKEYEKMVLPNLFKGDIIEIQSYNILRIVSILNKNPNSSIIIEGFTSGLNYEPEGLKLALKRAEEVKNAFQNWGISEKRIKTSAKLKPSVPSNQDFQEGIEENQRADIVLLNAPLQEYVAFQKFSKFLGNAFIKVDYENIDTNKKILVKYNFSDSILNIKYSGEYIVPLDKNLEPNENLNFLSFGIYYDTLEMMKNRLIDYLRFPRKEVELNLNNFEAILRFEYDKNILTDENKNLLKQLCNLLPEGTTIQIMGSTDALGTENRNKKLAEERAKNTESFIKLISKNKFRIETKKITNKFPESTPFGRFLNRSIRIKIKK